MGVFVQKRIQMSISQQYIPTVVSLQALQIQEIVHIHFLYFTSVIYSFLSEECMKCDASYTSPEYSQTRLVRR